MVKFADGDQLDPYPRLEGPFATLVRRQYGHATRAQFLEAGFSDSLLYSWARRGRLHRVHQGVYAVGYIRTEPIARAAAAVLAGGLRAALSHRSAAALWRLIRHWPEIPEVVTPFDRRAGRIRWHRVTTLGPRDVRTHLGIRTTSAARTLLDLAPHVSRGELERMVSAARITRYASAAEIDELTRRLLTHPGATRLRAAALGVAGGPIRSQLERRLLALLERHGLPQPLINTMVAGVEVDILFAPERLIVEVDGWEYHRDKTRFRRDRRRDAITLEAGYETLRLTDDQLEPPQWPATAALIERHLIRRRRDLGLV